MTGLRLWTGGAIGISQSGLDSSSTLRWRHNGRDNVSNHQTHDCLLNRLFRRRSKKTSKLRVTGLCAWNSPVTGEFSAQMASNVENVSIVKESFHTTSSRFLSFARCHMTGPESNYTSRPVYVTVLWPNQKNHAYRIHRHHRHHNCWYASISTNIAMNFMIVTSVSFMAKITLLHYCCCQYNHKSNLIKYQH